jgi:hypothetical protein
MNTTVIIPVHEYNEVIKGYLDKAIESVVKQEGVDELPKMILVYPAELDANIVELRDSLIRENDNVSNESFVLIKNDGKADYQSQVNLGVKSVTTEYFSVLEFDDEYSNAYLKNVEKFIKAYPDIDVFLTMMIEVNEKNEGIKMTNETVWAQQFVGENGEMGYLNLNALKQYTDFKLSGGVIKKSEFENLGGYKSNIKLTFMYEFLLRALNNACKIYTIQKLGYKHLSTRQGSMFTTYLNEMPVEERKFWFETATKESNFMNDRPIDTSRLQNLVTQK